MSRIVAASGQGSSRPARPLLAATTAQPPSRAQNSPSAQLRSPGAHGLFWEQGGGRPKMLTPAGPGLSKSSPGAMVDGCTRSVSHSFGQEGAAGKGQSHSLP